MIDCFAANGIPINQVRPLRNRRIQQQQQQERQYATHVIPP
jgi:hypothetical protein